MKSRSAAELIDKLVVRTKENLSVARQFSALPSEVLHLRPRPDAWNVLECLAHLNHYSEYYLPEIRRQINKTKHRQHTDAFTSSWLGNKFAAGMKPGPQTTKISTFKSADPRNFGQELNYDTITNFIRHQEDTLELLEMARQVDMTRTKTGISITSMIRLRLGDTLRVVVYHNWRHIDQAQRALAAVSTVEEAS
ncbi:MAG: DinB family protein [Bacteroidota bacterium]